MTGGVEVDAKRRTRLKLGFARTQGEHLLLGYVEIVYVDVDVGLLWMLAARPHGRLMVRCELERERGTAVAAQLHPIVISTFNLHARDGAVERGERAGITAVECDDAQSSDWSHEPRVLHQIRSPIELPKRGSLHG